ncbi:sugar ABC transporter substrate-binding protein [Hominifimenecus sp. rT4P-3]|uniref:sugar ABC transporter substrate-binding protein n=1 Tax=Hominifimenecus sp. rT4P-3 TaxID=3242979 RepID=UPI003DA5654E
MKKRLAMFFCLVILGASCAAEPSAQETACCRIGVSLPHTDSVYRSAMKSLVEQKYQDNESVEIILADGEGSQKKQNEDLRDMIDSEVDALVLVPNTIDGPIPMVRYANEKGIPVVVVDDSLDMTQGISVASLVTSDNEEIGKMAADLMLQGLEEKYPEEEVWNVVELTGAPKVSSVISRKEGRKQSWEEIERLNLVGSYDADYDREHAKRVMQACLNLWEIHGILCQNDMMVLGVCDALRENGLWGKPVVIGIDGQREVLNRILDGAVYGTVVLQPQMICDGIEAARGCLNGEEIPAVYRQEAVVVTAENVLEEMQKGKSWKIE